MTDIAPASPHLIIPFASSLDEGCQAAIQKLSLPNLASFLRTAELVHEDAGDEFNFIPPHERVIGLSQQIIVTPCHWSVGIDNIRMENPDDLQLTESESRALFAAVAPYFESDGITLTYDSALRWFAQGESLQHMALQGMSFASLDRVIGRNVDVWQPQQDASKHIRRLQNEVQMLLYTHLINEARETNALPTVNSFWLSRAIDSSDDADFSLRDSALRGDWHAWADAWKALDKNEFDSKALKHVNQVTLCGERHAVTYKQIARSGILQGLQQIFARKPNIHMALKNL